MIRYTKQFYANSCAPTALINAAKWAGYRVPGKEYFEYFALKCRFSFKEGTTYDNIGLALRRSSELKLLEYRANPRISFLDKHLKRGHGLIITYMHPIEAYGHAIFCPAKTDCFYYVVNHSSDKTVQRISVSTMNSLLREKGTEKAGVYSAAWAVRPK